MTNIKSNKENIAANQADVFNLLADYRNFNELLPEQVTNWKVSGDTCSFTIRGMADISLQISEKQSPCLVVYSSLNPSPFPFQLVFDIQPLPSGSSVVCEFKGELNPMLQMLAKSPLQNFVNMVVERLRLHFEG